MNGLHGRGKGIAWPVVADDNDTRMTKAVVQHEPVPGQPLRIWLEIEWETPP